MSSLRDMAMACYNNPPDEFWKGVRAQYNSRSEVQYEAHHIIAAYKDRFPRMANRQIFDKVKKRGKDTWDTKDLIAMSYIIWSGRPICDGCGDLVTGVYFTCWKCFHSSSQTFNTCRDCQLNRKFYHHHEDFIDNYELLHTKREQPKQLKNGPPGTRPLPKN